MATEEVAARFTDLDAWSTIEAIEAMWEGQLSAVASLRPALHQIAAAADAAADVLSRPTGSAATEGRVAYIGAGTSGRLAVQDGAELPPTFDWPRSRLVFVLAGGPAALVTSVEGAEDDPDDARRQVEAADLGPSDVVIGVAASGVTTFTVVALELATARGALTIGISNNPDTPLLRVARHPILVDTGSELLAGSTRMKAGTAQKAVLNLLSTQIMVRLGRVHGGLMVNVRVANAKLRARGVAMVARLAGCAPEDAEAALAAAGNEVKPAVLVARGLASAQARALLSRHRGNLRAALAEIGRAA